MKHTIHRGGLFAVLALTAACTPTGAFQGRLLDAATGAPRANERVVAKATSDDLTCQTKEATSGADGAFTITETCANNTYNLEPADKTLALDAPVSFDGGAQPASAVDVKVWRAPRGDGVYLIADDKITELTKAADVFWEPVFPDPTKTDTFEKALYASTLPDPMTRVPKGGYLAISGADNLANLKVLPLIEHAGALGFPHPESGRLATVTGASWVGLKFKADTVASTADLERIEAKIDSSKVVELKGETWATRLYPADAAAIAPYAIFAEGDSRMYIVGFGDGPPIPAGGIMQPGTAEITPAPAEMPKKGELKGAEKPEGKAKRGGK